MYNRAEQAAAGISHGQTRRRKRAAGAGHDDAQPNHNPLDMTLTPTPADTTGAPDPGAMAPESVASTRVLRQFRLVFNIVKTHFQQVEKKVGIGGAQVWALHVVHQRPGIGVHELALAMDVRQPTASNLVKSLVSQGLMQVRKEGQDRRAVQLHVLAAGIDVLRRAPGPFTGVLPQALARLDGATLVRLEQDLNELIGLLGANERAAGIPLAQM